MKNSDRRELVRHFVLETGDDRSEGRSAVSSEVTVLVAAAVLAASSDDLLVDAGRLASSTQDRQFVAIAAAYLSGDHDRVDALTRDHLIDHPSRPVLAWIVAHSRAATTQQQRSQT